MSPICHTSGFGALVVLVLVLTYIHTVFSLGIKNLGSSSIFCARQNSRQQHHTDRLDPGSREVAAAAASPN